MYNYSDYVSNHWRMVAKKEIKKNHELKRRINQLTDNKKPSSIKPKPKIEPSFNLNPHSYIWDKRKSKFKVLTISDKQLADAKQYCFKNHHMKLTKKPYQIMIPDNVFTNSDAYEWDKEKTYPAYKRINKNTFKVEYTPLSELYDNHLFYIPDDYSTAISYYLLEHTDIGLWLINIPDLEKKAVKNQALDL